MKKYKKRKTSPRPLKRRGREKRPDAGENLRKCWADPVWRAALLAKRAAVKRRGNGRLGVPDGMRKADAELLNAEAENSARETMTKLKAAGATEHLDDRGEEALTFFLGIMRKPGAKTQRMAAARVVLEYTKAKPASKSDITVNKAEEWLAAISAGNDDDEGETSKDA